MQHNKNVFIISTYPPTPGGISNYTKRTVSSLRGIGVVVHITPFTGLLSIFSILYNIFCLKPSNVRMEYDISTYEVSGPFLIFGVWVLKQVIGYRLFFNFHEVTRDLEHLKLLGQIYYSFIANFCDFITVHTNESKNTLISKCSVKENRVFVIPLGTMSKDTQITPKIEMNSRYAFDEDFFLFIGFIHPQKGIENFIKAAKELETLDIKAFDRLSFVVAGGVRPRKGFFKIFQRTDNLYFDSLKKLVEDLGLQRKVKFLGYIEDKFFSSLIVNSEAVVIPYVKTEQSGVLNQVLPYQVPIIASNIGGIGETLKEYGLLVEKDDYKQIAKYMHLLISDHNKKTELLEGYNKLNKELDPISIAKKIEGKLL